MLAYCLGVRVLTGDIQVVNGTNAYAVMAAPRASGAEAIIISASWLSRTGEGDGTLNLRGVATVLSLAGYLKSELYIYIYIYRPYSQSLSPQSRVLLVGKGLGLRHQ